MTKWMQMKKWIDNSSYEELLRKWRFAPVGDPFFQDAAGDYYVLVMELKKRELTDGQQTATSIRVGWES